VDAVVAALDLPPGGTPDLLAAMRQRPEWARIPILSLADSLDQVRTQNCVPVEFQDCQMKFDREAMLTSLTRLASALDCPEAAPVCVAEMR
jgi:hypothetical protein